MKTARIMLTLSLVLASSSVAVAATKFWKNSVASGNWSTGNNWSNVSAAGADNGGAPGISDTANVSPTDGVARTVTYDVAAPTLQALFVDLTPFNANRTTLNLPGSNLNLTDGFILGSSGRATINHSGGTLTTSNTSLDSVVGFNAGSEGIYNLSGSGAVSVARDLYVGTFASSVGVFNQSGGTNTIAQRLVLGSAAGATGNYVMSGGTVTANSQILVGSSGNGALVIQPGGTAWTDNLAINNTTGGVTLSGGTLRFNTVTNPNRITYNSGTIQIPAIGFNAAPVITLFGATPTIPAGKTLRIETIAFLSPGISAVVNGGHLDMASLLNDGGSALSVIAGSAYIGDPEFVNRGFINVTGSSSSLEVAGSLTVESAAAFGSPDAILNVSNGATVFINGDLIINHLGFNFPPTAAVNFNGGTLRFKDYIKVVNATGAQFNYTAGTIQLAGNRNIGTDATISTLFGAAPTIPAVKGLTVEGTATLTASPITLSGGTLSADTLVLSPASRIATTQASVVNAKVAGLAGSLIDAAGGNLTLGNAAAVNGFGTQGTLAVGANTVTLLDANDVVFDSLSLATLGSGASPGTLNAANGLTLDFGGNITGFGTLSTPNLLAKPLINNGHITGTSGAQRITLPGYVKGVGTFDNVNFTGTFSPGLSPTILAVGNIALSNTSTLVMELGGIAAGSGFDQIQSTGALAFDGILQVTLINGFTPTAGLSFNLFDWLSTSGTFDTLALPTLAGLAWNTSLLYSDGILSLTTAAGVAGDYNQDGRVNAADYTVWRNNLGRSTALPNDDTAGVGPDDFTRWKNHFGESSGSGAAAATGTNVPEPTTVFLLACGLVTSSLGRKYDKKRGSAS